MPARMKIRSAYSTLPAAERRVADFILENPDRAALMVINEIAEAAGVSVPSVTRLAKKLGYDGFMDFRVALASGSASITSLKSDPVRNDDPDGVVVEKIFLSYMRSIEDTLKAIRKDDLGALAEHINNARRIFIFGAGSSAMLADDFCLQLNMLGYDAVSVSDPVVMELFSERFSPSDVFLGISRSGRTKNILDSLRAAKKRGAFCAFISNYITSPAAQVADSFFCTARVDDVKAVVGRESNVSMYALTDALLVLVSRKSNRAHHDD